MIIRTVEDELLYWDGHFVKFRWSFLSQYILKLHQHKWKTFRVDILALLKIINEKDTIFIPKIQARTYPADVYTRNFLCGVSRYAATHLAVVSFSVHSDVTRFRPWSTIETGNHFNCTDKIPLFALTIGSVKVFNMCSGISVPTSRRASAGSNLSD